MYRQWEGRSSTRPMGTKVRDTMTKAAMDVDSGDIGGVTAHSQDDFNNHIQPREVPTSQYQAVELQEPQVRRRQKTRSDPFKSLWSGPSAEGSRRSNKEGNTHC